MQSIEPNTQALGDKRIPTAAPVMSGVLADRQTSVQLREEIDRLHGHRKRILGQMCASGKRDNLGQLEKQAALLMKANARLLWCLDELIARGATEAMPVKDTEGKIFPRYDYAEERRKAKALADLAREQGA